MLSFLHGWKINSLLICNMFFPYERITFPTSADSDCYIAICVQLCCNAAAVLSSLLLSCNECLPTYLCSHFVSYFVLGISLSDLHPVLKLKSLCAFAYRMEAGNPNNIFCHSCKILPFSICLAKRNHLN